MTKMAFLLALNQKLSGLVQADVEERLRFYSEMIEDRMEEGLSEAEAVAAVGTVEEIAAQIFAEFPNIKEPKPQKKRLKAWQITLLAAGSPVWVCLLIAGVAVVLSLYVSLWAVLITLWAVFASLIGCALGGVVAMIGFVAGGHTAAGMALLAAGMVCAGLAILLFFGCKAASDGTLRLTKKCALATRNCFGKKEASAV